MKNTENKKKRIKSPNAPNNLLKFILGDYDWRNNRPVFSVKRKKKNSSSKKEKSCFGLMNENHFSGLKHDLGIRSRDLVLEHSSMHPDSPIKFKFSGIAAQVNYIKCP